MASENHEEKSEETEEKTPREEMLIERLGQTLDRVEEIEKKIPELTKEYEEKAEELLNCTDKNRLKVLKSYIREKRLYIKQLQETRRKLIREIRFIFKMHEEA